MSHSEPLSTGAVARAGPWLIRPDFCGASEGADDGVERLVADVVRADGGSWGEVLDCDSVGGGGEGGVGMVGDFALVVGYGGLIIE